MSRLLSLISAFFLLSFSALGQCVTQNTCVPATGEYLKYGAYFNWGAIWVKGGEAIFEAQVLADRYKYNIKAYTMPKWRWVYDLNTQMEGYMLKDGMKPVSFTSHTFEDKKELHEQVTYPNGKLRYQRWGADKANAYTAEVPHPACSFDLINEVYASRCVDLLQYKPGEKIPFNVFFSDTMSTVYGEVIGLEKADRKSVV